MKESRGQRKWRQCQRKSKKGGLKWYVYMMHREEHYVGRRAMRMGIKEDDGNGSARERQ